MSQEKKGFAPTAESHRFSANLLWSGLLSGCRMTGKSVGLHRRHR